MSFLKKLDWVTVPFFSLTFLTGIIGLSLYIPHHGVHPLEPIGCAIYVFIVAMVVSGGYHRYFAHRTFRSHTLLKIFYLIVGAAAFQQSALEWSSDHRLHHRYVDTEKDPYSITKGFWWAHIGWIFAKDPADRAKAFTNVPDLTKDKWVMWQHRYLYWIAIPLAFGLPLLIGFLIGRPLGMFLWVGVLRIVINHHTTFTINSISHMFGTQPYTDENSARDVWWLAPFLCGENYHNYHHCFPGDYRNGIYWYQWDPTKWALWLLSHTPLVTDLHEAPSHLVLKARLAMDLMRVEKKMRRAPSELWLPLQQRLLGMRLALEEAAELCAKARQNYQEFKKSVALRSQESLKHAQSALRERETAFKQKFADWQETLRNVGENLALRNTQRQR